MKLVREQKVWPIRPSEYITQVNKICVYNIFPYEKKKNICTFNALKKYSRNIIL